MITARCVGPHAALQNKETVIGVLSQDTTKWSPYRRALTNKSVQLETKSSHCSNKLNLNVSQDNVKIMSSVKSL